MRKKLHGLAVLLGAILMCGLWMSMSPEVPSASETRAAAPTQQWAEQVEEALGFALAWLYQLDMAEFGEAAIEMGDIEVDQARLMLEAIRADIGLICSSRTFENASVLQVSPDETEFRVQLVFEAVFIGKRITETLEVFLWANGPIVLSYKVSEES